jgi:uncharacterized glyoxalase superfamily protein PhnB
MLDVLGAARLHAGCSVSGSFSFKVQRKSGSAHARIRRVRTPLTMMWPTLTVRNVDASLAFYRDKLGFEVDLHLRDDKGSVFLGSVEVGDTVIMFESPDPREPLVVNRGSRSGVTLTILLPDDHDIDTFYTDLHAKGVRICNDIGDRPWGHRNFSIRDPDGYCLIFARSIGPTSPTEPKAS